MIFIAASVLSLVTLLLCGNQLDRLDFSAVKWLAFRSFSPAVDECCLSPYVPFVEALNMTSFYLWRHFVGSVNSAAYWNRCVLCSFVNLSLPRNDLKSFFSLLIEEHQAGRSAC